jgi:hypothetical protein
MWPTTATKTGSKKMSELDAAFQDLLELHKVAPELVEVELGLIGQHYGFPTYEEIHAYFDQWLDDEIAGLHV